MPTATDFPARGKVLSQEDRTVIFAPLNTTYHVRLESSSVVTPGGVVDAILRVTGRKVWTVPSGGNFLDPIYGPPRRIQGRIKYLDENEMVVHAGTPVVVKLPTDPQAYDLARGPLAVGGLVNVSALPGGTIEVLGAAVQKV